MTRFRIHARNLFGRGREKQFVIFSSKERENRGVFSKGFGGGVRFRGNGQRIKQQLGAAPACAADMPHVRSQAVRKVDERIRRDAARCPVPHHVQAGARDQLPPDHIPVGVDIRRKIRPFFLEFPALLQQDAKSGAGGAQIARRAQQISRNGAPAMHEPRDVRLARDGHGNGEAGGGGRIAAHDGHAVEVGRFPHAPVKFLDLLHENIFRRAQRYGRIPRLRVHRGDVAYVDGDRLGSQVFHGHDEAVEMDPFHQHVGGEDMGSPLVDAVRGGVVRNAGKEFRVRRFAENAPHGVDQPELAVFPKRR